MVSIVVCRRGDPPRAFREPNVVVLLGVIVAPARTFRAVRAAAGVGTLFDTDTDYERLLQLSVGELRALLSILQEGLASDARGLRAHAPGH